MTFMNHKYIDEFLAYGFIAKKPPRPEALLRCLKLDKPYLFNSLDEFLGDCNVTLLAIFNDFIADHQESIEAGNLVVPLTGGMDSRIILSYLTRFLGSKKIKTISGGTSRSIDSLIPSRLTNQLHIQHASVDFDDSELDFNSLITSARASISPAKYIERSIFHQVFNYYPTDRIYVTGFMGDPLAGSHINPKSVHNPEFFVQAMNNYGFSSSSSSFTSSQISDFAVLNSRYTLEIDQIDMLWRQRSLIFDTFASTKRHCFHPFADRRWIRLWINLPIDYRQGKQAYKAFANAYCQNIFNFTEAEDKVYRNYMKLSNRVLRKIKASFGFDSDYFSKHKFIDFSAAFRERDDFKRLYQKALIDTPLSNFFKKFDPESMFLCHQERRQDLSSQMLALCNYSIYMHSR